MQPLPAYEFCFDSQWLIRWNVPTVRDGREVFEHEMLLDFELLDRSRVKQKIFRKHMVIGRTENKLKADEKIRYMCSPGFQKTLQAGIAATQNEQAGYTGRE
jgi:hypothetical protein